MSRRFLLLLLGVAACVAPHSAQADMWDTDPVVYACQDGLTRHVVYRADGNYAWVSVDGAPPVELPRRSSPHGSERYATAHFSIDRVASRMTWRVVQGRSIACAVGDRTAILRVRG